MVDFSDKNKHPGDDTDITKPLKDESIDDLQNRQIDDKSELELPINTISENETENKKKDGQLPLSQEEKLVTELNEQKKYLEKREELLEQRGKILDSMFEEQKQKNSFMQWLKYDVDIENCVPPGFKKTAKRASYLCLLTIFALSLNFVGQILVASLSKNVVLLPMNNVIIATINFIFGSIGAVLMFKCLYYAVRVSKTKNTRSLLIGFWLLFCAHVCFIVYSIVGLPNWATIGIFNVLTQLGPGGSWAVVVIGCVSIFMWGIIAFISIAVAKDVRSFNNSDLSTFVKEDISTGLFNSISLDV